MSEKWGLTDIKNLFLIVFAFVVVSATYSAIKTPAVEGDSLAYHIPISEMMAEGNFWQPHKYSHLNYYPGSGETILSFFYITGLSLNLFNVLAIVLFFFVLKNLAKKFDLDENHTTIFAVSSSSLYIVIRWLNAQVIDIWLALFFALSLSLLLNPQEKLSYFLKLGIALGLLVGVKYTGPIYFILLILVFGKDVAKKIDLKKLFIFFVPFTIFGLSWYIRNLIVVGNPIYPQPILGLEGHPGWEIFTTATWQIMISHPVQMFNALFGEYLLWIFTLLIPPFVLLSRRFEYKEHQNLYKIIILGICSFILYLFLFTSANYQIMVSSVRYSIPAFVCFILSAFIIFKKYNNAKLITYIAFLSLLPSLHLSYHPKLTVLVLPLFLLLFRTKMETTLKRGKQH